jgi:electron transfer flavoprotein alpha subunit
MSLATVRRTRDNGEQIIFSIGRGAVPYIDSIRALAEKYGASIAASSPVVDSGAIPYEYQVGLTGKTVSPAVYVAFGISGAVQHTSAISGAGTVIAINSGKNARTFDYSDFGIVAELKELF